MTQNQQIAELREAFIHADRRTRRRVLSAMHRAALRAGMVRSPQNPITGDSTGNESFTMPMPLETALGLFGEVTP